MQIVAPPELESVRVLERSETVAVVSSATAVDTVRLLAPKTYALLAEAPGTPVWPGRATWQETVLRQAPWQLSSLTLVTADGGSSLSVPPPGPAGWQLTFLECGKDLCSFTWEDTASAQHVDVVRMKPLERLAGYSREVRARRGVVHPSRAVVYHADLGLRLVAEDQDTGAILWKAPLSPPDSPAFDIGSLQVIVTGNGRYVLAIYGGYDRFGFLSPRLEVFDAASGKPVDVDAKRFTTLADDTSVSFESVPGSDNLVIVGKRVLSGGESPTAGLHGIVEVEIPSLTGVSSYRPAAGDSWRIHAPRQVIPLASGRVLFAATR